MFEQNPTIPSQFVHKQHLPCHIERISAELKYLLLILSRVLLYPQYINGYNHWEFNDNGMFVFHYHIGVDMHWSYLESMTVSFVLYNQHMHKVQDTWHMLPHLYSSHNICYTYTSVSHYRLCGRIFQYITIKSIQIHIYPIYDTQLFKFLANSSFLCFASPFVPILLQYSHRGLNYPKKNTWLYHWFYID